MLSPCQIYDEIQENMKHTRRVDLRCKYNNCIQPWKSFLKTSLALLPIIKQ
jgi:hypothetical protein